MLKVIKFDLASKVLRLIYTKYENKFFVKDNFEQELNKLNLNFNNTKAFATPRRLAISISELQSKQQDQVIEKKGPSTQSPEMAINGFAKSCGVSFDELEKKELAGKEYFFYSKEEPGQSIKDLLPSIIEKSIKDIPITRPMKWGEIGRAHV